MKILIVGGTGLAGADAALHLREQGHDITLMARKPSAASCLEDFEFLQGDYVKDDLAQLNLGQYEALVFAAAADIRYLPMDGSVSPEDFYAKTNTEAVPAFFAAAKAAGITRAVYIGTFYPQVAPHRIGECAYVTSRHLADEGVRALADETFHVCSLNPSFILGHIPGLPVPHLDAMASYAKGQIPDMPVFAPPGGTNHISSRSIAIAIGNALIKGENGKAYLIGDENYSWQEYLQQWFDLAGNAQKIEVRDDIDHPMLPAVIMFAGAGSTIAFEPNAKETELLGYPRNQISELVKEIVTSTA